MSKKFGSANKNWRDQNRSKYSSRRYPHQMPCDQGYYSQRSSRNDQWRRPDYRGYENDYSENVFASASSAVEASGGVAATGVGIFITPCYTDFGNSPNRWKSNCDYNGFKNNRLDASSEKFERWQSSPSTRGGFIPQHRNGPSNNGVRSSFGNRSIDRRNQNLRDVPYAFDVRDDCSHANYSSRRPTDQRLDREGENSEFASSERLKESTSSSASKSAGKEMSGQDQSTETEKHSGVHSKVEKLHRRSKSLSKMQNNKDLNAVMTSENVNTGFDKTKIPSLMSLKNHDISPENYATNGKKASKNGSKSPRRKKLSKVTANVRQKVDSSLSGKDRAESEVSSSSKIRDSIGVNTQLAHADERIKQKKTASVPSAVWRASESVRSPESDVRSGNAGVRPKVDIVLRKKRSHGLSKEDLMKLISSPRSRQEHMQLNRILQAHAEKQKTPMQHAATSETEEHEDVEPSSDNNELFKEIEVSELPIEIQREIDILCQNATDVNHSDDVNIINLSETADERPSVSNHSPPTNAASDANATIRDKTKRRRQGTSVSAAVSTSQGCSSEMQSRALSSGCSVTVEENPGTFNMPSVSQRVDSQASASTDCQAIANESRTDQGGIQSLGTLLQISLREEEIRGRLKETEAVVKSLQEQLNQLKEQLGIKLSLRHELTKEKVRLRSLRLQILRESVGHQHEDSDSTVPVTPVSERLSNLPYESIIEVTPNQNIPPVDSSFGFDSVMRNGVINIEPVNDDYESGGEAECPQYENGGTVQLITIVPTEGGESSDEGERSQGTSSGRERSACAVTSVRMPEQHHNGAHQVLPVTEELDSDGVSVQMEYVGTLSASNLQPEVLQQIALSLQPMDSQNVSFHSSCVAGSSVNEFSCSEDETLEPRGSVSRTLDPSGGTNKKTPKSKTSSKRKKTDGQPQELDDCVISRVEKPVSRKSSHGLSESDPTAGSAGIVVSGKMPSHRKSGESPRVVARTQRVASASHVIPISDEMPSSSRLWNVIETPRTVPETIRISDSPRSSTSNRLQATVSTGDGPLQSTERICEQGRIEATARKEKLAKYCYSTGEPNVRKRRGAVNSKEPQAKRRKSLENSKQRKTSKTNRMTIDSIYPRAHPGVLYRHGLSAKSIVLSGEVVITASDDGQIVRHPLPRQVYGLAEKQTFTGHQQGVVGLIAAKVQVSRDICRTVALSIGRDQILKMHCIQTGKVLKTHTFDKIICYDCICEANDTVFVGLDDGSIARITTSSFVVKEPFTYPGSSRISALASFTGGVRPMLLIGFGDCTISVRDASNNGIVKVLRGYVRAPRFIVTLNDRIASSSGDCWVFLHCLKNFNTLEKTLHLPSPVVAMTIQVKHELIVVACRNKTVLFIDIKENLRYITHLSSIEVPLTCIAASHQMVYFGCNNGLVQHIDIDLTKHWSCGFSGCKDWFLLKGDLEEHIREDHCDSGQINFVDGQFRNVCTWRGCSLLISGIKRSQKALEHFLGHITTLEAETSPRSPAVTN